MFRMVYETDDCTGSTLARDPEKLTLPAYSANSCEPLAEMISISGILCDTSQSPPIFSGYMHPASSCASYGFPFEMLALPSVCSRPPGSPNPLIGVLSWSREPLIGLLGRLPLPR